MTPLTRRGFTHLLGLGIATAAFPSAAIETAATPARRSAAGSVRLSANENPYGPCGTARAAMHDAIGLAWRYPDEAADALVETIARLHGVSEDQIILGDGSSEILKLAAAAFSGPGRKVVVADPTFEAIGAYGTAAGAEIVKVPLDASFAHDLVKMADVPDAAVIYVCNPNNPTGSITPKHRVLEFIRSVRPDSVIVVDEAYYHYAGGPDYESVIPLVQSHPNLVVARTFSKIYGMAGIRCGYAIAPRAVIEKMDRQKAWDSMNVIALAGARASLLDAQHAAEGQKRNGATRQEVVAALRQMGFDVIPSQANFIMIHLRRNVRPVIAALRGEGVRVGRPFPALPEHLRVTIGRPEEMQRFLGALKAVTG